MTILSVGSGQQYETIAAAVAASQDGDVVQVQAGTYTNDFATINTKITIEGVGGTAHLVATTSPPDGKAILTTNTDVTIKNLEFSGAAVADGNGAGIRYQGGALLIENSYFHDNQEGLLAGAVPGGTITIRNSEFSHNGTGDGYTHNLYVGDIATLTIEGSYFHDAIVGHQIKSRAEETVITNSRIVDGGDGTGSYSIDLPNGGEATVTGNLIEQGANSQNPAIIHFGGEGTPYAGSSLAISGNTIVNDLGSSSARLVLNQTNVTATVSDNAVYGLTADQIATGSAEVSGTTILASRPALDLLHPGADSDAGTTTGIDAGHPVNDGDQTSGFPDVSTQPEGDGSASPTDTAAPGTGTTGTPIDTPSSTDGTGATVPDASGHDTGDATDVDDGSGIVGGDAPQPHVSWPSQGLHDWHGSGKFIFEGHTFAQMYHLYLNLTKAGPFGDEARSGFAGSHSEQPVNGEVDHSGVDAHDTQVTSHHATHHFDPWG